MFNLFEKNRELLLRQPNIYNLVYTTYNLHHTIYISNGCPIVIGPSNYITGLPLDPVVYL